MSAYYSDIKYNYETSYKIDGVDYKLYIPRLPREDFEGMALEAVYDDVIKRDYKEVYDIFEKNRYSNFQDKVEGLVHAMKEVNGKNWNSNQYIWFYDNYFNKYFALAPEPVYVPNLDYSSYTNNTTDKKKFDLQAMFDLIGDDSDEDESSDEDKSTNVEKVSATELPNAFDLLYPDGYESEDYSSPDESSCKSAEKMNEKELKKIKNAEQRKAVAESRAIARAVVKADRERSKAEAKVANKLAKEQLKVAQKQEKQTAKDAVKAAKQAEKDAVKATKQSKKATTVAKKMSSGGSNKKTKKKRKHNKKLSRKKNM
jgi:hypothetical protein